MLNNLGNALLEQQRAEEALPHYKRAASLQPPTCIVFNGLANALETLGRYGEARAACLTGIRLISTCDLAHYNLGRQALG